MAKFSIEDPQSLLASVVDTLLSDPGSDFEASLHAVLVQHGCDQRHAILLTDYLISACGRAFVRELGATTVDTYQRALRDGGWTPSQRFSDDPLWPQVEEFAERLRTKSDASRKQFSILAQHSAELGAINNAMKQGMKLDGLKGAVFACVFNTPLPEASDIREPTRSRSILSRARNFFRPARGLKD